MNFFKRALMGIQRRLGKTVILLLLVFILGTVISGAISVRSAVDNTEVNLRSRMRPVVSFARDFDGMSATYEETGEWPTYVPLTADIIRTLADLEYVNDFHYSVNVSFWTDALENWEPWMDEEGVEQVDRGDGDQSAWLTMRGTSTPEPLQIREEFIFITEGRTFTNEEITVAGGVHPVLVPTGFARHNNLSIDSNFDITLIVMHTQEASITGGEWDSEWAENLENIFIQETFTFQVVGLFDAPEIDSEHDPDSEAAWLEQVIRNHYLSALFVPNSTAELLQLFEMEGHQEALVYAFERFDLNPEEFEWFDPDFVPEASVTGIIELGDVTDLVAFRDAALEILPAYVIIEDTSYTFSDISTSMENLQGVANVMLWGAVGSTLLVLSLLITLFLRDRRHEMGVYLALGEKKSKIVSQILLEVTITALVGMTLAVFTGSLISTSMSRSMLRNELVAEQNNRERSWSWSSEEFANMGFGEEMSIEGVLDAFDTSLDLKTVGWFYVVGLGTIIFSTVIPVMYVITLDPKKVLMEQ